MMNLTRKLTLDAIRNDKTFFSEIWKFIRVSLKTDKFNFIVLQWYCGTKKKPKSLRSLEDLGRVKDALELKERFRGTINKEADLQKYRDLNAMTFSDLEDLADILKGRLTKKQEKAGYEDELVKTKQATILLSDDEWKVVIPQSEEAAKYYGRNTRWCTAADNNNMFDYYKEDGLLYVFIHKADNRKWQIHFEAEQFMDAKDNPIEDEDAELLAPIINKIFPSLIDDIGRLESIPRDYLKYWVIPYLQSENDKLKFIGTFKTLGMRFIINDSKKIQIAYIRADPFTIRHFPTPISKDIQMMAVSSNGYVIKELDDPCEEVQLAAVEQVGKGDILRCIKNPCEQAVIKALKNNFASNWLYVNYVTPRIAKCAISLFKLLYKNEDLSDFEDELKEKSVNKLPFDYPDDKDHTDFIANELVPKHKNKGA